MNFSKMPRENSNFSTYLDRALGGLRGIKVKIVSQKWSQNFSETDFGFSKPEQLLQRPVSIKRPDLYFLKKSLLNDQYYLNFKF